MVYGTVIDWYGNRVRLYKKWKGQAGLIGVTTHGERWGFGTVITYVEN